MPSFSVHCSKFDYKCFDLVMRVYLCGDTLCGDMRNALDYYNAAAIQVTMRLMVTSCHQRTLGVVEHITEECIRSAVSFRG